MDSPASPPKINLRITQASLNQTAFNFPRNFTNIITAIDKAVEDGSDLLCFEELALTAYDAGDDFQKTDNRVIGDLLRDVALYAYQKNPNLIISIGHPWRYADKNVGADNPNGERHNNALYNRLNQPFDVQSFLGGGKILGMTAKNYLFNYERGYEKRYFTEWNSADADEAGGQSGTIRIRIAGQAEPVPFGRPILQLSTSRGAVNLVHVICEEKWIASKFNQPHGTDDDYDRDGVVPALARQLGSDGLVAVISDGSPPAALKIDKHIHLAKLASRYADAVINTDGLGSSGSTFAQFGYRLAAQDGDITSYGSRLNFSRVAVTSHTVAVKPASAESAAHVHASVTHELNETPRVTPPAQPPVWDRADNPSRGMEEVVRMTALWLFDYMRKTNVQGVVEALSGGADSAFNTAMVPIMVRLAVADLGVDGFCREMKHLRYKDKILQAWREKGEKAAIQTCLDHMLTSVYMGTNNSSEATLNAARLLHQGGDVNGEKIDGIGGKFMVRNVQDLIDFYATVYAVENTSKLAPQRKMNLQEELSAYFNLRPGAFTPAELKQKADAIRAAYPEITGDILSAADPRHAVAYENIQARARQALVMMIANVEGKMAIANPNLDEGRNAYATFGGDLHSGTINLNGFLPKAMQLNIMRHLYEKGLDGIAPIRSLALVLKNKPSAELQPKNEQGVVVQNDEDALQRNFAQMNRIAELMLLERTGEFAERRLNPTEVFDACQQDKNFDGVDTVRLYNMVRFSYHRWGIAQHKIHASPIQLTFGNNVDHQTSLRTPNLSGQDQAELAQLGISLLFKMAQRECGQNLPAYWGVEAARAWQKHALQDEDFAQDFGVELRLGDRSNLEFDIGDLYQRVKENGLAAVFEPPTPQQVTFARHNYASLVAG